MGDQRLVVSDPFRHGVAPAPLLPGQGPTDHGATTGDGHLISPSRILEGGYRLPVDSGPEARS